MASDICEKHCQPGAFALRPKYKTQGLCRGDIGSFQIFKHSFLISGTAMICRMSALSIGINTVQFGVARSVFEMIFVEIFSHLSNT